MQGGADGAVLVQAERLTAEAFAPFGCVVEPGADGAPDPPSGAAAPLDLSQGTPRFYLMRLAPRGLTFDRITFHAKVTQTLGAMGGRDWYMAVAAPGTETPSAATLRCFHIPGTVAVRMHKGTWHAGPYFSGPACDFFNLELDDTNVVDHTNHHFDRPFRILPPAEAHAADGRGGPERAGPEL